MNTTLTVNGLTFRIDIEPDQDFGPPWKEEDGHGPVTDFERLRQWRNDQWYYCGVIVTLLDEDGRKTDYSESLWSCESDCEDHLMEEARNMADEIISRLTNQYQECA